METAPISLTSADNANHIAWICDVTVIASASASMFLSNMVWQPWENGTGALSPYPVIFRVVQFNDGSVGWLSDVPGVQSKFEHMEPIARCEDIPPH